MSESKGKVKRLIQIETKDIKKYRNMYALNQKYICPLCNNSLASGGVISLDHSHSGGQLRGTLHSSCNVIEGRIKANAQKMQKVSHYVKTDYLGFLRNLIKYLEYHEANPRNVIHPSFDLETGKQKPKKRVVRRKATPKGKS